MTATQEPWRTLLEVLDIVGGRLYGGDWVGKQPQTIRVPVMATADDMRRATEPSRHAPDLPTEEVTLPLHFEANAQEMSSPEVATRMIANGIDLSHLPDPASSEYLEKYNAWCRRDRTETKLREVMSRYDVKSIWRDTNRGEQGELSPAQWSPGNSLFWINPVSGDCGDSYRGPDNVKCLIDRAGFAAAIEDALKTPAVEAESATLPVAGEREGDRITAVLDKAIELQKELKTDSHHAIASAMRQFEGFSDSTIRKILDGRYPPAKKRGFDGLDAWALSQKNKVPT